MFSHRRESASEACPWVSTDSVSLSPLILSARCWVLCAFLGNHRMHARYCASLKQELKHTCAHSKTKLSVWCIHRYKGLAGEHETPSTSTCEESRVPDFYQRSLPQQQRNSRSWELSYNWKFSLSHFHSVHDCNKIISIGIVLCSLLPILHHLRC